MTEARKTAHRIFRKWCEENSLVVEPMAAADLVARIEAGLALRLHRSPGEPQS